MSKPDGGSSFPGGYHHGMTLRDYFAGQALAGICASDLYAGENIFKMANMAYANADAMIAERDKGDDDDA